MARKFLYLIAVLIVLVIAAMFALRMWSDELAELALTPTVEFTAPDPLANDAYASADMWYSRPGIAEGDDPSRWLPSNYVPADKAAPAFVVFFVHPTSDFERTHWNAPLSDPAIDGVTRLILRSMASAFGEAREIWTPRYRQATFGTFLTDKPEARQAIDLAYQDVAQAFDYFTAHVAPNQPIVLVGHSQGAQHLLRLLREKVPGSSIENRIVMAYPIGWPISVDHDLSVLPFPACNAPDQVRCIAAWSSFAEPADPSSMLREVSLQTGFDGETRGEGPILCVNPLTGTSDGTAPAAANPGTLLFDADFSDAQLVSGAIPARCDDRGLLLIGDPPAVGPMVLPGNNYHAYDILLFWQAIRNDVRARVSAWAPPQR